MADFRIQISADGSDKTASSFKSVGDAATKAGTSVSNMAQGAQKTKSEYADLAEQINLTGTGIANLAKPIADASKQFAAQQTIVSGLRKASQEYVVVIVNMEKGIDDINQQNKNLESSNRNVLTTFLHVAQAALVAQRGYTALTQGIVTLIAKKVLLGAAILVTVKGFQTLKKGVEESYEKMQALQQSLTEIANIGDTPAAFERLANSAVTLGITFDALKDSAATFYTVRREMGLTVDQVQRLVDAVIMVGKVGGNSQQNIQNALNALSQGMASDSMDWDQMKTVISNVPLLAKMLSDEIAKGGKSMKDMAAAGELTAQVMAQGLLAVATQISEKAGELPQTLSESEASLRNQQDLLGQYLGSWTAIFDTSRHYNNVLAEINKAIRWMLGGMTEYEAQIKRIDQIKFNAGVIQNISSLSSVLGLDWVSGKSNALVDRYKQQMDQLRNDLTVETTADQQLIFNQQFDKIDDLVKKFKTKFAPQKTELEQLAAEYARLSKIIESSLEATTADQQQKKQNALDLLKSLRDETKARLDAAEAEKQQIKTSRDLAESNQQVQSIMNSIMNLTPQIRDFVRQASALYRVPKELIYAVLGTESRGSINAVSPSGAQGLMQLMPKTARGLGVQNPFDPFQNIMGGTKLLNQLLATYGDLQKVLSAYNSGGPNGRSEETINYVKNVTAAYNLLTQGVAGNIDINDELARSQEALQTSEESLRGELSLATDAFAQKVKAAEDLRRSLNPLIEAQEKYNTNLDLARFLLDGGRISEGQYNQFLIDQAALLEKVRHPNAERLSQLRAELELYTRASAKGLTSEELKQQLSALQEIEKLNPADVDYDKQVEQIRRMVPEIEKLKEGFSDVTKESEVFKTAAGEVYRAWTDMFESVLEKGFRGFKGLANQILVVFRNLIANLATLTISKSVIAPVIQGVGSIFGLSGNDMASLLKQFGVSGGTGGTTLSSLWESLSGLFSMGGVSAAGRMGPTIGQAAAATGAQWVPYGGGSLLGGAQQSLGTTGGMTLGMYGMAGMGGYMAGSYIGGGTMGSQIGGASGAMAGAAIGSMVYPVIGTIIGAIAGAIVGALAGGALGGGKEKTRLVTMSGGATREYDIAGGTRMMTETEFGKFGFGQATKNMDKWLADQGAKLLATVKEADATIASLLKPEEMTRAKAAIEGWKRTGDDVNQALLERYRLIIDTTDTLWKELALRSQDVDDLLKRFGSLRSLQELTGKDILGDAAKQMESQFSQAIDTLRKNTDNLLETMDGFTGTTEQLQKLTNLTQDRYALELQLLTQVKQAIKNISATLDTSVESIKQSMMTTEQLYPYLTQKAQDLAASILTLKDPTEIQSTVDQIATLVNQAYGLLTPEQKQTVGSQYMTWLDQVKELANYQLNGIADQLVSESQKTAQLIKDALDSATQNQAVVFRQVGDEIIAAIQALKPTGMASGGFVQGAWNGRRGIAGDTVLTALTPGEAVIPRDTAQRHRALIGAMFSGRLQYRANGTEEEYVSYLRQHANDYFPGGNVYVNYVPGREFEVRRQRSGKDEVLAGTKWLWDWMSRFDLPKPAAPEPTPAPAPTPEPAPAPTAPSTPAPLPAIPAIPSAARTDLKPTLEALFASIQNQLLSASRQRPGWDELGYQQQLVKNYQAQVAATAGDPDKQLAALEKLRQAVTDRYAAEMEQVSALKSAAAGIKDYLESIKTSELSPLTAKQKLEAAQSSYQETLAKAMAGDTTAAGKLQGVAQEYLGQARSHYASSPEYTAIFGAVTQGLEQFSAYGESAQVAQASYDEMNASLVQIVDLLNQINADNKAGAVLGGYRLPGMAAGGIVEPAPAPAFYSANIVPFQSRADREKEQAVAELKETMQDVVDRLDKLGIIVQVSTQDQTRNLIQSRPKTIESRSASTRQVF